MACVGGNRLLEHQGAKCANPIASFRLSAYSTLCLEKNDTDVAHYNFNVREPILVIFGRDVARRRGLGVLGRSGPVEYS